VPKARTPEEGVPLYKKALRLTRFGRGEDRQLPLPAGQPPDPRLTAPADGMRKGYDTVRGLMKKTSVRTRSRSSTRRA